MGGFDQRSGNHFIFFKYRHIGKAIIHPYIPSHKSQMTVTPFHFDEHFGIVFLFQINMAFAQAISDISWNNGIDVISPAAAYNLNFSQISRSKATSYPYPSFFKYSKNWAEWKIISTLIFSHKNSSSIIKFHNDEIIKKKQGCDNRKKFNSRYIKQTFLLHPWPIW